MGVELVMEVFGHKQVNGTRGKVRVGLPAVVEMLQFGPKWWTDMAMLLPWL